MLKYKYENWPAEISAGFEEGAFTIQNWKVKKKIGTINVTRYYKETPEGVSYMCKAMEDRIKENVQTAEYVRSMEIALKMLTKGSYTFDEISELTGLSLEEVQQLADEQAKDE